MKQSTDYLTADQIAEIVETRFPALVLYARSWNAPAAEDLVQESLLKLIEQEKSPPNPVAWLFKTIRNGAISRHRKTERRERHETEAAKHRPQWFVAGHDELQIEEVTKILSQLPDTQREVVVLRIWNQLSFEEIAELTETPKTTVFRSYTQALEELRKRMD